VRVPWHGSRAVKGGFQPTEEIKEGCFLPSHCHMKKKGRKKDEEEYYVLLEEQGRKPFVERALAPMNRLIFQMLSHFHQHRSDDSVSLGPVLDASRA